MAWIELHQSVASHRKTLALADLLDLEPVYVVGHLSLLWQWGLDNAPSSGFLGAVSPRVLAIAAQWRGDPDRFTDALVAVHYLDQDVEGRALHNWPLYAGRLLEQRLAERERSRQRRAEAAKATAGQPKDDRQTTVGTVPNPTVPNRTQPEIRDSHESRALTPASFRHFLNRLQEPKANTSAILAEAVSAFYGIECQAFSRIGKMAGGSAGEMLKLIYSCAPQWNGVDDPLDYLTVAVENKRKANGRARIIQHKATNDDAPDMTDAEPLGKPPEISKKVAAEAEARRATLKNW